MKVLTKLGIALAVAPLFAAAIPAALDAQQAGPASAVSAAVSELPASVTPAPVPAATVPATASAVPASAQSSSMATTANASNTATSGPTGTAVALRMKHATSEAPAPLPRGAADSKTLMIVGLAAVVVGIVVGDDAGTILILGGAGIGLYGLYKYMQ